MTHTTKNALAVSIVGLFLVSGSVAWGQDDGYKPIPSDARDVAERVIFKFQGSYNFWQTDVTDYGTPQPRPFVPGISPDLPLTGDNLRTDGGFLSGSAALGTRRILLPTLNTYAVFSGGYDLAGAPDTVASKTETWTDGTEHRFVSHAFGDSQIFVQNAYAELEGLTETGMAANLSVRAGRQTHWGVGPVTFDGGTLAYDDGVFHAGVRGGQRAGIYDLVVDDPGVFVGGDVAYDLSPNLDVPILLRAEYEYFAREVNLNAKEAERLGEPSYDVTVGLAEVAGYVDLSEDMLLSLRVKITDAALSRARAGFRWSLGDSGVSVDLEQKIGEDVFFDLAGGKGLVGPNLIGSQGTPRTVQRASTLETFRVNIPDLQPYTDLNVRVPIAVMDTLVIEPQAGVHYVEGETDMLSAYDATYYRYGINALFKGALSEKAGIEFEFDYLGRSFDRSDIGGESGATTGRLGMDDQLEGLFTGVAAGPEISSHEVFFGARYNRGQRFVSGRMLGNRNFSLRGGYFLRAYTLQNRRFDINESQEVAETMGGFNASAKWLFTDSTVLKAEYEFARDSNVFYSHMGDFQSVTGRVEVAF
jgi:hypothetical protein